MFASATRAAVGGQFLDVAFERRDAVSMEDALTMTERKSGSLVALMFQAGAFAGAAQQASLAEAARVAEACAAFGRTLGTVYQLSNDWADARPESAKSDRARGKKTLPLVIEAQRATPEMPPAVRAEIVNRSVMAIVTLHRRRARAQLDRMAEAGIISPLWLEWLVDDLESERMNAHL